MAEQAQTTSSSGGGSGKTILIIVLTLLLLCCCCAAALSGFVLLTIGGGVTAVNNVAQSTICESSGKTILDIYTKQTTEAFKARVSEAEFSAMLDDLQSACTELKGLDSVSALTKGLNISYSNENGQENLTFSGTLANKKVDLKMKTEAGELKIDDLKVL